MGRTSVSLRIREKLGHEASEDLALAFEEAKDQMVAACEDKFEMRLQLVAAELRQDMAKLETSLRVAMADMRTDMIRWSFLFWVGQIVTIVSVLAYMLRSIAR
jgi:hypothetical protein